MIKFAIAFHRREGLDHAACTEHYRDKHGPLCRNTPGMSDYCRRYLQNDLVHEERDDHPTGLTLGWFDNLEDLFSHFTVPAYLPIIRPDELSFSRIDNALVAMGEEHIVQPGGEFGDNRVFRFLRAKADGAELERFRATAYGPEIAEAAADLGLLGYSQTVGMAVDLPFPPEQIFDGFDEFIFDTQQAAKRFVEWEADLADRLGADAYLDADAGVTLISSASRQIFPTR